MISPEAIKSFTSEFCKMAGLDEEDVDVAKRQLDLWDRLSKGAPVTIKIDPEAHAHGGGYYDSGLKEIGLITKDPESLAHELGHHELDQSFFGRLLQHPVGRSAFPWTPVAGALGGVLLSKGKKRGLLLPIATAAPTLLSEWLATRKGADKLEEAGATPEEIKKYRKTLKDSFGSYSGVAGPAALSGALGYYAAGT